MVVALKAISNLAVTNRCNGRCSICSIWKIMDHNDPSTDMISQLFTENKDSLRKVSFIQLTGGEPFMRDDLPEIASIIQDTLPRSMIWIPTNGLQPYKTVEAVRKMLVQTPNPKIGVTVSIDGNEEYHDRQRGVHGCFHSAVRTLIELKKLKPKFPGLQLSVGFTLTGENLSQVADVQELAYHYGVNFSMRPVNISEHYYRNSEFTGKVNLSEAGFVVKKVGLRIINENGFFNSLANLAYLQGMTKFLDGERDLPCSAASESVYIDSKGDVYPCLIMNQKIGNAYSTSLKEILDSEKAENIRALVKELKCPKCWLECEVFRDIRKNKRGLIRALYWTVKPFSLLCGNRTGSSQAFW